MNDLTIPTGADSVAALMFNAQAMDAVMSFGKMMANAKLTIPEHLRNKPDDCAAVCMQALQWRFNPFAVAQKTHVSQSGALGYEAQLLNAAIITSGKIKAAPDYEFIGDWSKILGKVEERKSERGGKYYVATWERAHEAGLGIIVRATLTGESKPRELTVMMAQAWPRFSTQWATDPQQQISYLAVRKFARRYMPDVILGVYSNDELEPASVIDMGFADEVPPPPPQPRRRSDPLAASPAPAAPAQEEQGTPTTEDPNPDTGEVPPPPAATTKAPPPAPVAASNGAAISAGQVAYLRNKLKATGVDEPTVSARDSLTAKVHWSLSGRRVPSSATAG